jgi:hypothetical protein
MTVTIAGLPVSVYADAGVVASLTGVVTLQSSTGKAAFGGGTGISSYASAGAMLGVPGFGVGVEFQMRLADTSLEINGGAQAGQHLGYARLSLKPLTLRLVAFVEAVWIRLGELTLVSHSFGAMMFNLF